MQNLLGGNLFDYSKPVSLLQILIAQVASSPNSIILDFFSGSATTAHAVMQLNAEDGGSRRFIMVQLPEKTPEASEAYKAGYDNICAIGKERIRRAARKIKEDTGAAIDYGFRVFRLDDSNMRDVYYAPEVFKQDQLELFADNIKPGRTALDLLVQVMLSLGLPLSVKIERKEVAGKEVLLANDGTLMACFDSGINETFIKGADLIAVERIIFRDASFSDDTAKENVKQLLKQLKPSIEMRVI